MIAGSTFPAILQLLVVFSTVAVVLIVLTNIISAHVMSTPMGIACDTLLISAHLLTLSSVGAAVDTKIDALYDKESTDLLRVVVDTHRHVQSVELVAQHAASRVLWRTREKEGASQLAEVIEWKRERRPRVRIRRVQLCRGLDWTYKPLSIPHAIGSTV